ncbi:MAG TPA: zinc-dependent metalloprotease [Acidimicrobiales bacterium]|jgi:putative hydrolase|nr:zinc-dependent metalloprotease [Acidimicrobiales bacterium]
MTSQGPGDRGNPFQFLLGDLMNMLGGANTDQWELTRAFGLNVATGGTAEPNVEPLQRIRLEELARVAELHVTETTGMPVSSDGRRVTCIPVGRGDWTARALDAWRPVLSAMTAPPPGAESMAPPSPEQLFGDDTSGEGMGEGFGELMNKWAAAIGPMFVGLQLGSVVGHLSQRALGQYVLALPWPPADELLIVTANVASFAEDWSLPEEEALLWVCARELASHTVLSRPSVRGRLDDLLREVAESATAAQGGLSEQLQSLGEGGMDMESLQSLFGDPDALLGGLLTPEAKHSSDQLTSLAVVIDAYADHVAESVGTALVSSHSQLAEAWYRRRIERGKGEEAAGSLFGLDLEQAQVDRGRAFVSGVIERAGEDSLARLWSSARNLPTPAEVDAPGLWLERIDLPELDQPPADG